MEQKFLVSGHSRTLLQAHWEFGTTSEAVYTPKVTFICGVPKLHTKSTARDNSLDTEISQGIEYNICTNYSVFVLCCVAFFSVPLWPPQNFHWPHLAPPTKYFLQAPLPSPLSASLCVFAFMSHKVKLWVVVPSRLWCLHGLQEDVQGSDIET